LLQWHQPITHPMPRNNRYGEWLDWSTYILT
jgi:hypothetical protein